MSSEQLRKLEEMLTPEILRARLLTAGLFVIAYDALEGAVVDHIRDFYATTYTSAGPEISDSYKRKVLSLDPKGKSDALRSSIVWLKQHEVISEADEKRFIEIKDARNEIAHELGKIAAGEAPGRYQQVFEDLTKLLKKIEWWWLSNVELAVDPDYADKEIDESGVLPGRLMLLSVLWDVPLGDDEKARSHLNEFYKFRGRK